jgi:hypothetical protein
LPGRLKDIGSSLSNEYSCTGDLKFLEEAINNNKLAVSLTDSNSSDLPSILNHLDLGLNDRYFRTGDLKDLEKAIESY